jgi:hypothetical protein
MDIDKMLIEFRQLKDEWAAFKAKYELMLAESSVRYSAYQAGQVAGQVKQPATKEELDKILNQTEANVQVNPDGSTTLIKGASGLVDYHKPRTKLPKPNPSSA